VNRLNPISEKERILVIDVIRGFAIFGILLVNIPHFSYPDMYLRYLGEDNFFTQNWGVLDHLTRGFFDIFIQVKFITMFSFLFGFGMVIMLERAKEKGEKFVPIYIRRLLVLFGFGVIHAFLIWDGDILMDYAVLGLLLLLFRNFKPKTLFIWSIALFTLYAIPFSFMGAYSLTTNSGVEDFYDDSYKQEMEQEAKQAIEHYQNGTIVEVFKQRIYDRLFYMELSGMWPFQPIFYGFFMIPYFSMFLLGAAFAKWNIFRDIEKNKKLVKRIWLLGLMIGLPLNLLAYFEEAFWTVGGPFLMLFYMMSITLFMQKPKWQKRLKKFSAVGKTAFSNYILQSIICTFLFYSYGFGLYGKVYPFLGLIIAILIFALQIYISQKWLEKFRFGPLEWIWRTLTYSHVQRFRNNKVVETKE